MSVAHLVLPRFINIGAAEFRTSSLCNVLKQDPDVHLANRAEVDFFDTEYNYKKGLAFYSSFFKEAPVGAIVGEKSRGYPYTP